MPADRRADAVEPPRVSILSEGPYLLASVHTALDDDQLVAFQRDLVDRIHRDRAKGVIIDVGAMDVVDSFSSHTLRKIATMARLRGAMTVIVGISPELAITMVQLGMVLDPVHTALDLDEGLELLDRLTGGGAARGLSRHRSAR